MMHRTIRWVMLNAGKFPRRSHFTQVLPMLFSLLLGMPVSAGARGPELLEPEKAFRVSTRAIDERSVEVRFQIANGYYMYRDRFRFETEGGTLLADAQFPKGEMKEDEFFGRTETYRREVRIRVPVGAEDAARGILNLKVTSQGCADVGVCYVPLEQFVQVRLDGRPSGQPAATLLPAPSRTDSLWNMFPQAPAGVPDGGAR